MEELTLSDRHAQIDLNVLGECYQSDIVLTSYDASATELTNQRTDLVKKYEKELTVASTGRVLAVASASHGLQGAGDYEDVLLVFESVDGALFALGPVVTNAYPVVGYMTFATAMIRVGAAETSSIYIFGAENDKVKVTAYTAAAVVANASDMFA